MVDTIILNWTSFSGFVTARGVPLQWLDVGDGNYYLYAFEGPFSISCIIPQSSPASSDQSDFETNYKTAGNKPIIQNASIQTQPPYGSKTIMVNGVTHSLFSRITGQQYSLVAGVNTITYTATYAWSKLIGVEAVNCEALDTVDFQVYDNSAGSYSGVPNKLLNQFSFALNLPKDYYIRMSQFDADIYPGMVISMTYTSRSAKTVGINFLLDQVI